MPVWSTLVSKAARHVIALTHALTFDPHADPQARASRGYWLHFMDEETQRRNDLSKGNRFVRVTAGS